MKFTDDDQPPLLTQEEAERAQIVLVQRGDGWYVADTLIDPETGGVFAVPQAGAKPNRIEIVED